MTSELTSHFQEIELKRPQSSPSELLGLTLCYEDEDEEGNTEIFIDDIHPLGLAARDGRLRLGDQIIQVRGRTDSESERPNWTTSDPRRESEEQEPGPGALQDTERRRQPAGGQAAQLRSGIR